LRPIIKIKKQMIKKSDYSCVKAMQVFEKSLKS